MAHPHENVQHVLGHLFRHEAGRMAAVLTRYLGAEHFEIAEDLVQDTLLKAMETWPFHNMPENPSAWLYKVAKNKAIDFIRAQQSESKNKEFFKLTIDKEFQEAFSEDEIKDSVLRMMFTCCHPAIPAESQIALTLKTLGGLSNSEIAHAFLTNEEAIAKRIYRAKEKIREAGIKLVPPDLFDLSFRLDSVLKVLYLIFNEGYYASEGQSLTRDDLCEEAMRLTYLLIQHRSINLPKVRALMALMCLQASRLEARTNTAGDIILLEYQDRSKWNQPLIQKGLFFLEEASDGNEVSEYHVEAAIASVHALAADFRNTKWGELVILYNVLYTMNPNAMIALNRAIAIGFAQSPEIGIEELMKIDELQNHYLLLCALGTFYLLNQQMLLASQQFKKALPLTISNKEKELITRRLEECSLSVTF